MNEVILRTEHLTQRFGGLCAVHDANIQIHKNDLEGPGHAQLGDLIGLFPGNVHVVKVDLPLSGNVHTS